MYELTHLPRPRRGRHIVAAPAPVQWGTKPSKNSLNFPTRKLDPLSTDSRLVSDKINMHGTRDLYKRIDEVLSPDGAEPDDSPRNRFLTTLRAGGITSLPAKALRLLESGVPGRSILRESPNGPRQAARKKREKRAWIDHVTPEPRSGKYRPRKEVPPEEIAHMMGDPFTFPSRWARKRAKQVRAHEQIALDDAADLEDEVWHLWLDIDQMMDTESGDSDGACGSDADAASAGRRRREGDASARAGPVNLGQMRFIVDTGCGSNLIALKYLRRAGAMGEMRRLPVPITLNTPGGPSRALGSVSITCDKFPGRTIESVVMPQTPGVLSVGTLCMEHGYSFYWRTGRTPYLLLPNGMRLDLTLTNNIPYLYVGQDDLIFGAPGRVDGAAPAPPMGFERWACVVPNCRGYLDYPEMAGGPPLKSIRYRTTLELHSLKVIAEDVYDNGIIDDSSDCVLMAPASEVLHGQDTLTYFYYVPPRGGGPWLERYTDRVHSLCASPSAACGL